MLKVIVLFRFLENDKISKDFIQTAGLLYYFYFLFWRY